MTHADVTLDIPTAIPRTRHASMPLIGVLACLALFASTVTTKAQGRVQPWTFSADAGYRQANAAAWTSRLALYEPPPHTVTLRSEGFSPGERSDDTARDLAHAPWTLRLFRLYLAPFSTPALTSPFDQEFATLQATQNFFDALRSAQNLTDLALVSAEGFVLEATLDFADVTSGPLYDAALASPPALTWRYAPYGEALQVQVSRLPMTSDLTGFDITASIPFDTNRVLMLSRTLMVAQVHGQLFEELSYDVYAATFAADSRRTLFTGVRIGHTFGNSGFALGVNYDYKRRANESSQDGDPPFPFTTTKMVGINLLYDNGPLRWQYQLSYGVDTIAGRRIAVSTQPTLRIGRRWTVFYRFDSSRPAKRMPKTTEHVLGLRFFPASDVLVKLHAEGIMQRHDDRPTEAWGFRLAGTVRF